MRIADIPITSYDSLRPAITSLE